MGCLNSTGSFRHWFGNIHLSGPCNRSCYFCIGQHMMALDPFNTLDSAPLPGFEDFVARCREHGVREVYVTGTNTDPLLYKHTAKLVSSLRSELPGVVVGIRTNAVKRDLKELSLYDKGSVTVCSLDTDIYRKMMGNGNPPPLDMIVHFTSRWSSLKVNIVLGPENWDTILDTIKMMAASGIKRINLREPYGQPHQGNPLAALGHVQSGARLGMPVYKIMGADVVYWDVHYVEVESVNLYANGTVSEDYPITRGHSPKGVVLDQNNFVGGRVREQWVRSPKLAVLS